MMIDAVKSQEIKQNRWQFPTFSRKGGLGGLEATATGQTTIALIPPYTDRR